MSLSFGGGYAQGELSPGAAELLPARHRAEQGRRQAVARAAARGLDPVVRAALVESSAVLPASDARARALAALGEPGVSVVVTGQQVGLFLGPLYSMWKAATAVAWAARLEQEAGNPVVPVFWLQTEDHDLDEIARARLSDARGGVHAASVTGEDAAQRVSIAHRTLGDDVTQACDHVAAVLNGTPHADAVVARLRATWRPGRRWAEAFSDLLGLVFADSPLVVLDPRTPALAGLAAPVHRRALEEHEAIAAAISRRAAQLESLGYRAQVPPRADCALSFFHPDGPAGPRYRLRASDAGWALADGTDRDVTGEVAAALEDEPLRFSSSALLRPLIQDTLLPTAAYVGGPGEVSYWAQLPPVYEHFGLPLPLVIPRATGLIVDAEAQEALTGIGLPAAAIDADLDGVLDKAGPPPGSPDFTGLAARARAAVAEVLAAPRASAEVLDPPLLRHFDRTCDSIERDVSKLEQRLVRAALRGDEARVRAARRAIARLRPDGTPQDRASCWPDLAARVGEHAVGPLLLRATAEAVAQDIEGTPLEVRA